MTKYPTPLTCTAAGPEAPFTNRSKSSGPAISTLSPEATASSTTNPVLSPASAALLPGETLATLAPEIKNKMWLYHYNPGPLPNAEKDGFLGFVKKSSLFEF